MNNRPSISITIKEATSKAHLELEKKVIRKIKAIEHDGDYADFLKYFYAYFSHLERQMAPFITKTHLPDYSERRNSSYLLKDIKALGGNINSLPKTTVPTIENQLQGFGALYVMEGSIMGGRIIVSLLEKRGITKGMSFFSGYGEATGQMWTVFQAAFDSLVTSEEQEQSAIHIANETFRHFSLAFDQVIPKRTSVPI